MDEQTLLRVRLTPRGGRNALDEYVDGILHARVSAPPADGLANKALIALIADALSFPKSSIEIQSGSSSRVKVLKISRAGELVVLERIASYFRVKAEH